MQLDILGIPVDMIDMEESIRQFQDLINQPGFSCIVTPNSEIIVNATKDPELERIIKKADLVIPDGIGLVYASKILKAPLKERVTGIDFLGRTLEYLASSGKSIFLFGSKPGVADAAAEKMIEAHPGLKIAGTRNGYFRPEEEGEIVAEINASGADFLCVALGSPKQEIFMDIYRDQLNASVGIGVGGSLDVWAGTLKRAPEFYQKHGLEWFYRFIQQPSRYKRMAALPAFMIKVMFSKKR